MLKEDPENFENVDYRLNFLKLPRWVLALGFFFIISIFMYFPIGMKIDTAIHKALGAIPGCSIGIKDYSLKFFLPRGFKKK